MIGCVTKACYIGQGHYYWGSLLIKLSRHAFILIFGLSSVPASQISHISTLFQQCFSKTTWSLRLQRYLNLWRTQILRWMTHWHWNKWYQIDASKRCLETSVDDNLNAVVRSSNEKFNAKNTWVDSSLKAVVQILGTSKTRTLIPKSIRWASMWQVWRQKWPTWTTLWVGGREGKESTRESSDALTHLNAFQCFEYDPNDDSWTENNSTDLAKEAIQGFSLDSGYTPPRALQVNYHEWSLPSPFFQATSTILWNHANLWNHYRKHYRAAPVFLELLLILKKIGLMLIKLY